MCGSGAGEGVMGVGMDSVGAWDSQGGGRRRKMCASEAGEGVMGVEMDIICDTDTCARRLAP